MKCVICHNKAPYMFQMNSLCEEHLERNWDNIINGRSSGTLVKMKKETLPKEE